MSAFPFLVHSLSLVKCISLTCIHFLNTLIPAQSLLWVFKWPQCSCFPIFKSLFLFDLGSFCRRVLGTKTGWKSAVSSIILSLSLCVLDLTTPQSSQFVFVFVFVRISSKNWAETPQSPQYYWQHSSSPLGPPSVYFASLIGVENVFVQGKCWWWSKESQWWGFFCIASA